MKRLLKILLIFIFFFSFSIKTDAKTLKDLKNELAALEQKKANNDNKKKQTQNEINSANNRIQSITGQIANREENITRLTGEIATLEAKAKEKEAEIKELISYMQVSSSENLYLEYIVGSKSIEDLVLRSAVSEQMVAYNDNLIEEYNNTVIAHKNKQEEMRNEITSLNKEQNNLEGELVSLGDELHKVMDVSVSIDKEIEAQKKTISYYQNTLKCKDDQDITTCGTVAYSGKFLRPTNKGYLTSSFGYRTDPVTGRKKSFHSGTDMVTSDGKVYPVAPGTVAGIYWKTSCGGTMLFINHNVGGTHYTSGYFHLYQVKVSIGQKVDVNTQIAVAGGNNKNASWGAYTPWDSCSTGRHIHLSIARGWFFKEYTSYSTFTSKLINPVSVVNFPKGGKLYQWFYDRTTVYK